MAPLASRPDTEAVGRLAQQGHSPASTARPNGGSRPAPCVSCVASTCASNIPAGRRRSKARPPCPGRPIRREGGARLVVPVPRPSSAARSARRFGRGCRPAAATERRACATVQYATADHATRPEGGRKRRLCGTRSGVPFIDK